MTEALHIEQCADFHRAVLMRPERQNSLTPEVVSGLRAALDACEQDHSARAFVLQGSGGHFSSGMDLAAAAVGSGARGAGGLAFAHLLERFTTSSVVVVSVVDGKASGGGVGLAAASDFVFASERSQFSLPEILWGLLPCVVAPFLIRRVGFQVCQRMTLSTFSMDAQQALHCGLVDGVDEAALPRLLQRLRSVAPESIGKAKRYFKRLSMIDAGVLDSAVDQLDELIASPEVGQRLRDFAEHGRYPWEAAASRVQVPPSRSP
ncbi:MAG: enoyl-CoA hydratase [Myxococcaceae bacterium]|nr:enoyl-CoA hydratase [Myxococcaceae bacterium]